MALLIPGTLTIMTRKGRYGEFNTGKLTTSIGDFVVKDKELDQYDTGKYQGQFEIEKIKSVHYTYGNCLIVECRAYLASMQLDNTTDLTDEEIDALNTKEQDPLEEEKLNASASTPPCSPPLVAQTLDKEQKAQYKVQSKANKVKSSNDSDNTNNTVISDDEQLFGLLWPLDDQVKLDSTCDRETLRKQKARLSKLGYEFDFRTQIWQLSS